MKQFIIGEDLKNGLLRYLATRPLQEVMNAFIALKELPEFPNENEVGAQNDQNRQGDLAGA